MVTWVHSYETLDDISLLTIEHLKQVIITHVRLTWEANRGEGKVSLGAYVHSLS